MAAPNQLEAADRWEVVQVSTAKWYTAPERCVTLLADCMKIDDSRVPKHPRMQIMVSFISTTLSSLLWHLFTTAALAQSACEKDGATSTYNQDGIVITFNNLCGKDVEAPLDYFRSPEPRRSDCIDRCVKQGPLCYGFDYTPYVSSSQNNCYLLNGTFEASNATYRNFVADAAMLDPDLVAKLPQSCRRLSLRDCFEQNSQLFPSASSSALPTASSSPTTTAAQTGSEQTAGNSGGLSTGAKAGIGAGVGLVALIAILSGILIILRRVKHKRAASNSAALPGEGQETNYRSAYPQQEGKSQIYAHTETNSSGLAAPTGTGPASGVEQIHEIDGRARHEK